MLAEKGSSEMVSEFPNQLIIFVGYDRISPGDDNVKTTFGNCCKCFKRARNIARTNEWISTNGINE